MLGCLFRAHACRFSFFCAAPTCTCVGICPCEAIL